MDESLKRELDALIKENALSCPFAVMTIPKQDSVGLDLHSKPPLPADAGVRDLYWAQYHCLTALGTLMNSYANFRDTEAYERVQAQLSRTLDEKLQIAQYESTTTEDPSLAEAKEAYLKGATIELITYRTVDPIEANEIAQQIWCCEIDEDDSAHDDEMLASYFESLVPIRLKVLQLIVRRPGASFAALRNFCSKHRIRLSFLHDLDPPDDEILVGLTYLRRESLDNGGTCTQRQRHMITREVSTHAAPYIKKPSHWNAMVYGENLGLAIIAEIERQVRAENNKKLRPAGGGDTEEDAGKQGKMVADAEQCPHESARKIERLNSSMPPYQREPDAATYPERAAKLDKVDKEKALEMGRWIFWNWQSGKWTWQDIVTAFDRKFGKIGREHTTRETLGRRADLYVKWVNKHCDGAKLTKRKGR